MSGFRHRGIVEGFYGTPWSHTDRLWWIERLAAWGMNRYVHAPKQDPLHRERWREPYPDAALREFRELVERGAERDVEVGFALSPGLSIRYASREDRQALRAKLRAFRALGARFLALALDDVPSELAHAEDRAAFASLAAAHLALAGDAQEEVGPDATLWLVPTDYLGVGHSDYLEALGAGLDPRIEVGWTGRTVLSPTVEAEEAHARSRLLRRKLLLWDNTPVADGPMRNLLHLNPYVGRAALLTSHLSGVLLNPMQHAHASGVTLYGAARYLADPVGYDAERAYSLAVRELGAGAEEAFALFAAAHRFSPLCCDRDRELEELLLAMRDAIAAERDLQPTLRALREAVTARSRVADALRGGLADRRLAAEIEPWISSHAAETRRIAAAVDCLAVLFEGPRAKDRTFGFLAFEARLAREAPLAQVSYGPRRVLYPQLASMRDDTMGLAADPTLLVDRCLADAFVATAEEVALARLGPVDRPRRPGRASDRSPSSG